MANDLLCICINLSLIELKLVSFELVLRHVSLFAIALMVMGGRKWS